MIAIERRGDELHYPSPAPPKSHFDAKYGTFWRGILRSRRLFITQGHMMLRKMLADYIKSKPRLYDFANGLRPISGEYEQFINERSKPGLTFAQIGANDGLRWDPLRKFIIRDKWQGLLVEPLPGVFELLKQNYGHVPSVRCINTAIGTNNEALNFWTFAPHFLKDLPLEDRLRYLRTASFQQEHLHKFLPANASADAIEQIQVPCVTVESLLKNAGIDQVDFIAIDTEGYDGEIVKSIDFNIVRPKFLVFESHNLTETESVHAHLHKYGYIIKPLGGDTAAILP